MEEKDTKNPQETRIDGEIKGRVDNEVRDRILKGAEELFLKYGIRSVSMDDVARHLSMSKKTLYQYFSDKDEIVTLVSECHMMGNQKQYNDLFSTSENAIDELVKISTCLKRDFQKINPGLLFDLQKYHPKAWAVWLQHKQKHIRESIIRNLKQGIGEGFFRPELNVEVMAATRMELIELTFNDQVFPQDKFNIAEVNAQIFEHFVYGLLTEKGRKAYEKYKQKNSNTELTPSI